MSDIVSNEMPWSFYGAGNAVFVVLSRGRNSLKHRDFAVCRRALDLAFC